MSKDSMAIPYKFISIDSKVEKETTEKNKEPLEIIELITTDLFNLANEINDLGLLLDCSEIVELSRPKEPCH